MTEKTRAELQAELEATYKFFNEEMVVDILRRMRRLHVLSLFRVDRLMMLATDGLGDGFELIYHRVLDEPHISQIIDEQGLEEAIDGPLCPICGGYNGPSDLPHECRRPQ